ncbi:MAG: hypothetical protein Q4B73_00115 [Lachnospiraceae bacterium]|nr:hypothetical protein [Lachnospiraceae bacterium]
MSHKKMAHPGPAKRPASRPQKGGKMGVMMVVITILAVILAINVLTLMLRVLKSGSQYTYEYSYLMQEVRGRDLPETVRDINTNIVRGLKTKEDSSELQHMADYYEAAMLYAALEADDRKAEAAYQRELMEQHEAYLKSADCLRARDELKAALEITDDAS